jgi:FkbM family methyltransferase
VERRRAVESMGGMILKSFQEEWVKIESEYLNRGKHPLETILKRASAEHLLVLYGCGAFGSAIMARCLSKGIQVEAICDSYKTGTFENSKLEIISPEDLKNKYPNALVLVSTIQYSGEITKKLQSLGFEKIQIILPTAWSELFVQYISISDFEVRHLAGYEWAYSFFDDDISKGIVLDRIRVYLLGQALAKTSTGQQYFELGIINLSENEVFVDGGCFTGDTAESFVLQTNGKYVHIYSFEPDSATYETAIRNLAKYENVDVIPKGLWSAETELKFYSDGGTSGSSRFADSGSMSLPVTSLDTFFAGKSDDELPTFIKMDIEGSEKEALLGAEAVIKKKRPKLAVCVYHKPEDVYELTQLIHSFDLGYQFTLRQHMDGVWDTILYAT